MTLFTRTFAQAELRYSDARKLSNHYERLCLRTPQLCGAALLAY